MKHNTVKYILLLLICSFANFALGQENLFNDQANAEIKSAEFLNSKHLEFSPSYYQNGIVYVVSKDPEDKLLDKNIGQSFFELKYAEINLEGIPMNPVFFSSRINDKWHEGPTSFNSNGSKMYFTRSNADSEGVEKMDDKGRVRLKIYEANRGSDDWEGVKELPFCDDSYSVCHPSLSKDGKTIYFASDMPGGEGGMDLYKSKWNGTSWSTPENLGTEINTSKNEVFPNMHKSGILFYSSNGIKGKGGLDIYGTMYKDGKWTNPSPAPGNINSKSDDLGLILNDKATSGFFSSDRKGGKGKDDIYIVEAADGFLSKDIYALEIMQLIALDEGSKERMEAANVYVYQIDDNGLSAGERIYETALIPDPDGSGNLKLQSTFKDDLLNRAADYTTNLDGKAFIELDPQSDYFIIVDKPGFATQDFFIKANDPNRQNFMVRFAKKDCVPLKIDIRSIGSNSKISQADILVENKNTGERINGSSNTKGAFESCLDQGYAYEVLISKDGYIQEKTTLDLSQFTSEQVKIFFLEKDNRIVQTQKQTTNTKTSKDPQDKDRIVFEDPKKQTTTQRDSRVVTRTQTSRETVTTGRTVSAGNVILLQDIYYDFNKSAIRMGTSPELENLYNLLLSYPSMIIELASHTDSRGTQAYNKKLSERRAIAVKNFLVARGIDGNRIRTKGYGETQIRNTCFDGTDCSEDEHSFNRRTEVVILQIEQIVKVRYSINKPFTQDYNN